MPPTTGSSPRLRGTVLHPRAAWRCHRFIPAPAGNSTTKRQSGSWATVHPRACGEQFRRAVGARGEHGSSPRLRGTAAGAMARTAVGRFIPAPAGNRQRNSPASRSCTVHPRACGEQVSAVLFGLVYVGSSPRLRGTEWVERLAEPSGRFIPAPAGNRASRLTSPDLVTVHPRACGEQKQGISEHVKKYGSSPRLRGTVATPGPRVAP